MLKLTNERENKGFTRSLLSQRAGIHYPTYCEIESQRRKAYGGQKLKIAKALEWSGDIEELFKEV